MNESDLIILLRLIIAHLLADFVFQTTGMVKSKKEKGLKSAPFRWHIIIVGLLTYILLADWTNWWPPLFIMALHCIIDLVKISIKKDNIWTYIGDQVAHLVSIIILWGILIEINFKELITISELYEWNRAYLIIVMAYILVSLPSGVLIGYLTQSWQGQLDNKKGKSLENAGKWIGIIERLLILTFILNNQWEPVGFLLAAKSVFRFGDLKKSKEQKKTEYILIGTLLSFTIAIFIGILVQMILN